MLTLIALNGQDKGRVFQLTGETPVLLGRQAPDIKLADAQTSRKHAEISLQNNTWLIRDLSSTNGTWVNGQKIMQITELEVGDRIVVGRHQFRVNQITDLPAPTPQPKTPLHEPLIGQDDLADMGVDLSESLSADILEEDGELPQMAEEALIDELDTSPADAAKAEATTDDDAMIDLDALLADVGSGPAAIGTSAPLAGAPEDESEAPAEQAEPSHEEAASESGGAASTEDDVLDLDAMLGDDSADASSDREQEETPADELPPKVDAAEDQPSEAASHAEAEEDVLDLDALLGTESETEETTDSSAPEHTENQDLLEDEAAEAEAPAELEPPAPEADTPETGDEVIDLDAQLEASADQAKPTEPESDDVGVLDSVAAMDSPVEADESVEEETQEPAEPDETGASAETEDATEDEKPSTSSTTGSLIDIDVLASAAPAATFGDKPDDDLGLPDTSDLEASLDSGEQPVDAIDELLGDLSDELDEKPEPPADAVAETSSEDSAIEQAILDDEPEAQQEEPAGDDDFDGIDKSLLLSPDEQVEVVSSYRKSRIKTFVILIICIAGLGAAGWFGYNYVNNQADATSQSINREKTTAPDRSVVDNNQPETTAAPTNNTTNNPAMKPSVTEPSKPVKPEQVDSGNSTTEPKKPIADAFADIEIPDNGDPFNLSDNKPTPPTPENATNETEAPTETSQDSEAGDGGATQAPTSAIDTEPNLSQSPTEPATTSDTQTLALASGKQDEQPVSVAEVGTTASDRDLELLAGAVNSSRSVSANVNEAATLLGARKVVYVVDASGSLVDSFPRVLSELDHTITELPEQLAFTVIFFGSDGVTEVPPVGLRWADDKNKRHLRRWIAPQNGNVNAWGRGDPLEALRRAFSYGPDEVVILSDNLIGRQVSQEDVTELLDQIAEMVQDNVEMIHVVQFFDRDPQNVLKTIAERFNGRYYHVTTASDARTAVDEDPFNLP